MAFLAEKTQVPARAPERADKRPLIPPLRLSFLLSYMGVLEHRHTEGSRDRWELAGPSPTPGMATNRGKISLPSLPPAP